eukprot:9791779-Alexandrium_andersonii.AAC.1
MSASLVGSEMCIRDRYSRAGRWAFGPARRVCTKSGRGHEYTRASCTLHPKARPGPELHAQLD